MTSTELCCRLGFHKWGKWNEFWNCLTNLSRKERHCLACPKKQKYEQQMVWRKVE